ncbi:MAG: tRNA (guanosine(46)-N7)-methyltransferase TrmB [Ruminobacter sp.]|jgi:tRNA (guanine-N7-)-methyltransferase|uniref:tRNA (guanine-N(7)-)-methyltransferase n=1 Tax=Ruminobacter amylophilus TaxID=867 RepID=A0A662ZKM7_9GAMM|nr:MULTISPECIES: tRNA (guanosine(46)-N7)-methyltransferase TrmB [Ruminobacter]MBQ3775390.1 tRNA (guanosine(46)-N7)-methyltransferase TrmB [Ruminobacter sp.]SFP64097.1 tRNA (guanine-N7-)-methyltransferase [Ruminobacter amylophilus]
MESVIEEEVPHLRRIKSYVLREGRLTTGQERALRELWPEWGIEYTDSLLDLDKVFGRSNAPLTVEIGFGMGKSLVEMASKAPERNFIGIEVHTPGIGACLADIRDHNISNLRVVHHDAVEVFNSMIPDDSVDTLQLYFPDPWHKARHHKRRIVKPEFLDMIMPKLRQGGVIHMATDWENYAEQMLEVLSADSRIENLSADNTYVPRPDFRPLTKFELRGQRLGHGVWDLMFRKK